MGEQRARARTAAAPRTDLQRVARFRRFEQIVHRPLQLLRQLRFTVGLIEVWELKINAEPLQSEIERLAARAHAVGAKHKFTGHFSIEWFVGNNSKT